MSSPSLQDFQKLKKLARFLVGLREVRVRYEWQPEAQARELKVFVDSDWAGCVHSRRSTSSGIIRLGRHTLKMWSTTQPTIALSSAEAEFYALVEGETRGIGIRSMLEELGVVASEVELHTDSSAAKSFASRRGVGKLRHIDLKELWLQEAVKQGKVRLKKVHGETNPADLLTKYLNLRRLASLCNSIGVEIGSRPDEQADAEGECW